MKQSNVNNDPSMCPCGEEKAAPSSRYGPACTAAKRDPAKRRQARTVAGTTDEQRRKLAR